jgi:predicted permease
MILRLLALLLAASWFAAWTFAHLEHLAAWPFAGAAMLLTGGFIPATVLSRNTHARWLSLLAVASGISVGLLTYFVMASQASRPGGARWPRLPLARRRLSVFMRSSPRTGSA